MSTYGPDFDDLRDFDDVRRGLVDRVETNVVRNAAGSVVWDNDRWDFLDTEECPQTVHPSLWRQGRLNREHGLYEICPGVYQLRGMDVSNMTLVEGEDGIIVIDPLCGTEVAAAAMDLYRRNRGDRPVRAVIYSHSHGDHYGGVLAVTTPEAVAAGECAIIAPAGFVEEVLGESVIAGPAMRARGRYQYGLLLELGPRGGVGGGLGQSWSRGTKGLIPPTVTITETGQVERICGVEMVFQMVPETEAPAELNLYLPQHRAFLISENVSHTLHNVLTLRGAPVRDAKAWAAYLTEGLQLFGDDVEILLGSHHWPTWGRERIVTMLAQQRDAYAYLHDQTVRLMNRGLTPLEIAEELAELPGELGRAWHLRGYYGSVSHNVKAVYQRYLGWYDGNPAHLWQLPPAESGRRYVEALGGPEATLSVAQRAFEAADLRWAAELLNHLVFAHPEHAAARELQARTFEELGWAQENATWRNIYLTGADELRGRGHFARSTTRGTSTAMNPETLSGLTIAHLFDALAIRLDGPRGAARSVRVEWRFTDLDERWTMLVANGVMTVVRGDLVPAAAPDTTVSLSRPVLVEILAGTLGIDALAGHPEVRVSGEGEVLDYLAGLVEVPLDGFPLALP